MYIYQESFESVSRRMEAERNRLNVHKVKLDSFLREAGFLDYKLSKKSNPFGTKSLTDYYSDDEYRLSYSTQVKLKGKYIFEPKSGKVDYNVFIDYIIQKENSKDSILVNFKYNAHYSSRDNSFSSYVESDNTEYVIAKIVDLISGIHALDELRIKLRKYRIDEILKTLE